jgi:hypothetical protein
MKQLPNKCIILMDGEDFRRSLTNEIDFEEFIRAKIQKLNFEAEPYYGASQYLKDRDNS